MSTQLATLVNTGQPQLYGTKFTVTAGESRPRPIQDPQRRDERRVEPDLNHALTANP